LRRDTFKKFKEHDVEKTAQAVFLFSMGPLFTRNFLKTDFDLSEQQIFNMEKILKDIRLDDEEHLH